MFHVSEAALQKIYAELQRIKKEKPTFADPYILLHLNYACCGPSLNVSLTKSKTEQYIETKVDDLTFIVHENQREFFENFTVDYTQSIFGMGEFRLIPTK